MAIDPGQWARDYYNNQSQRSAQEQGDAQQALMGIFEVEARRQAPWSDFPINTALQNQRTAAAYGLADYRHNLAIQRQRLRGDAKAAATPPGKIAKLIKDTDKAFGFGDPAYGLALANVESSFDPSATSSTGAGGLFQFTSGTAREYGLDNPYDPVKSVAAEARLRANNAAKLRANGVEPTPVNLYLAHQQGWSGAVRLLKNPNARAGSVTNPEFIRVNGGDPNASAGAFVNMWSQRFQNVYNQYKAQLAEEAKKPSQQLTADDVQEIMERQVKSPDDVPVIPEDEDDLLGDTTINGGTY